MTRTATCSRGKQLSHKHVAIAFYSLSHLSLPVSLSLSPLSLSVSLSLSPLSVSLSLSPLSACLSLPLTSLSLSPYFVRLLKMHYAGLHLSHQTVL